MINYLDLLKKLFETCRKEDETIDKSKRKHSCGTLSLASTSTSLFQQQQKREDNHVIYETIMKKNNFDTNWTPQSARNTSVKFPVQTLDIIPKASGILDGDWILRYSDSEVSSYPWQKHKDHHNFELVPWRKNQKNLNISREAWEPLKWEKQTNETTKILQKLHKIESRRIKKEIKKRLKHPKTAVKIRIIFSMEFHNRKLEMTPSKHPARQFQHTKIDTNTNLTQIAIKELESKHCGYFSQRNNENFKEKFRQEKTFGGDTLLLSGESEKFHSNKALNSRKFVNSCKSVVSYYLFDKVKKLPTVTTPVPITLAADGTAANRRIRLCRKCSKR